MDISLFIKSLAIGFLIAAPYGPVGLLTINRTLERGTKSGIFTFLGSLLVDVFFVFILVLGVREVMGFLKHYQMLIKGLSVLLLYGMGISMLVKREQPVKQSEDVSSRYLTDFFSAFGITLANPLAYLGFIPLFSLIGFDVKGASALAAFEVIAGVVIGIFLCWYILVLIVSTMRDVVSKDVIKKITYVISLSMIGVATYVLLSMLRF
ncbi:MAG TPA: LysE family transporter [Candidatus Paceibacterota bacterium]